MAHNQSLRAVRIGDAKCMTLKPELLKTSQVMESAFLGGSVFSNDFVEFLDCFSGMSSFKHLYLGNIRLREENGCIGFSTCA